MYASITASLSSCSRDCDSVIDSGILGSCFNEIPGADIDTEAPPPELGEVNLLPAEESDTGEPIFELIRISRNRETESNSGTPKLIHHYSRRQAWNKDETLIDMGDALVDAITFQPTLHPVPVSSARNWANTDPNSLIGIQYAPEPNLLVRLNVYSGEKEIIHQFDEYKACSLGQGEGSLSQDDRRLVLTCTRADESATDIIAYDLRNKTVLGKLEGKPNLNWAGYSKSGKYILVENNHYPDPNPELIRYDPDLENALTLSANPQHGDFALDSEGNDVFAMITSNEVTYIRLADRLQVTMKIGRSRNSISHGHISCQSDKEPNWCFISTYKSGHIGAVKLWDGPPITDKIFSLDSKPKEAGRVYFHWSYHRSSSKDYSATAKATVNRSGNQILFTSDWHGNLELPEEFLIRPTNIETSDLLE